MNGMIYLDVVTDELYKVVYEFTLLHFSLSALCLSLLSSALEILLRFMRLKL